MTKITKLICIDLDIIHNEKIQELIIARRLSGTVNDYLRRLINDNGKEITNILDEEKLKAEHKSHAEKMALIELQLKKNESRKKEEAQRNKPVSQVTPQEYKKFSEMEKRR